MKTRNLTHQEIIAMGLKDEDFYKPNIDRELLAQFEPLCTISKRYSVSYYDEKYHAEHSSYVLIYSGHVLVPHKKWNEKLWEFYLDESLDVNVSYKLYPEMERPNKVGAPTKKKMDAWLYYLTERERRLGTIIAEKDNKIAEFLQQINDSGLDVEWFNDGLSGWIERNGLRYQFRIDKDTGYISKNIQLVAYSSELDDFIKLSDNKFTKK